MSEQIVELLLKKLSLAEPLATSEFRKNKEKFGIGFCAIDDLLPVNYANEIYEKFNPSSPAWRLMNSFRERKLTTKQYDEFDPILKKITFSFQDQRVISIIERITGIENQLPDNLFYAGGLSVMRNGDFLSPHIDNSHDQFQKVYRRLNLLYYVSPDWAPENGGNLELWDKQVSEPVVIASLFNRLVLMETHSTSWHSVSKVTKINGSRCCVSNYYFSEESPSPTKEQYYHITSFMARPEEPIKRVLCKMDNQLRSFLRVVKKQGFGKKDVYQKKVAYQKKV